MIGFSGPKNERAFVATVKKMREVQECHHVAGEFPYLLKVWTDGLQRVHELVETRIKTLTGVVRVQTLIVLSSPKDQVTGLSRSD